MPWPFTSTSEINISGEKRCLLEYPSICSAELKSTILCCPFGRTCATPLAFPYLPPRSRTNRVSSDETAATTIHRQDLYGYSCPTKQILPRNPRQSHTAWISSRSERRRERHQRAERICRQGWRALFSSARYLY